MTDIRKRAEAQATRELLTPLALGLAILTWGLLGLRLMFGDDVFVQGILGSLALVVAGCSGGRLLVRVLPRRSDPPAVRSTMTWLGVALLSVVLDMASESLSMLSGAGVVLASVLVGVMIGAASTLPAEPEGEVR
ncbi:hypothetical protein GCM10027425_31780 [Alteromonas gracilis]